MEKPYRVSTQPIPLGTWVDKDPRPSLVLYASLIEERFFKFQMSETFPMIHMFMVSPDNPGMVVSNLFVLEEQPSKAVRSRIGEYVNLARFMEGFLGAITTMEIHLLDVTKGDQDLHKEALLLSLYDQKTGLFLLRSSSFHRDEDPGEPTRDEVTHSYDPADLLTKREFDLKYPNGQ